MSRRVAKTPAGHEISWEPPGRLGFVSSDGLDRALVDGITSLALASDQAGLWLKSGLFTEGVHEEIVGLLPRLLAPSVMRDGYELIIEPATATGRLMVLIRPGVAYETADRAECNRLFEALVAVNGWVRKGPPAARSAERVRSAHRRELPRGLAPREAGAQNTRSLPLHLSANTIRIFRKVAVNKIFFKTLRFLSRCFF